MRAWLVRARKLQNRIAGAFRFADGRLISIRPSVGNTLRYRDFAGGESRRLYPEKDGWFVSGSGFSARSPVDLRVRLNADAKGSGAGLKWLQESEPERIALRVNHTRREFFQSGTTRLHGRLDLPEGPGPHPAVVLVHGSGKDAATAHYFSADFYAAHGVAALTFDKRGTGQSRGKFTMDFHRLAADVLAGVAYLQSLPQIDPQRIGLAGYSQGGWVAPMAASPSEAIQYVIVNYGMIESPAEEARLETLNLVRKRGLEDPQAPRAVEALTRASVHLVATNFRQGWDEFETLKKKYAAAAWRKYLHGSPVEQFLRFPRWAAKFVGPFLSPTGLDWYYDSEALMESLAIPMLWLLGGEDEEAPNALTIPRLQAFIASGKPFELRIFPGADHGMVLFNENNGVRQYTGYAPGYFQSEIEYARRQSGLI